MSLADDVRTVRCWLSYCVMNPQPHGTPCAEVTRIVDAVDYLGPQATRRDEFARAALTGLIAKGGAYRGDQFACQAWQSADEMLVAEKRRP